MFNNDAKDEDDKADEAAADDNEYEDDEDDQWPPSTLRKCGVSFRWNIVKSVSRFAGG